MPRPAWVDPDYRGGDFPPISSSTQRNVASRGGGGSRPALTTPPLAPGRSMPGGVYTSAMPGKGAWVSMGTPVMVGALPGQYGGLDGSQSLPALHRRSAPSGGDVEAVRREMKEMQKAHEVEVARLEGLLVAAKEREQRHMEAAEERAKEDREDLKTREARLKKEKEKELARLQQANANTIAALQGQHEFSKDAILSAAKEQAKKEAEALAAQERQARVDLLFRQVTRRMMNQGIASGWAAWHELWSAKRYALDRLRQCGNRLKKPALPIAFEAWLEYCENEQRMAKLAQHMRRETELGGASAALEAELKRVITEYEQKLVMMADENDNALRRQLIELTGTAEEQMALRAEKDKEERVELLRRQITRRMMNQGIASGFAAWYELWEAKVYSLKRLRECGNRLKSPALADAFTWWERDYRNEKQAAEMERLAREANSIEAQLRRVRHEKGQLELKTAAHEDELTALRDKVFYLMGQMTGGDEQTLPALQQEVQELRDANRELTEAALNSDRLRSEAEDDASKQRVNDKRLLERLLAEQRAKFEDQLRFLTDQKAEMEARKERQAKEARIELLRKQSLRRIKNRDIANGLGAWVEYWQARTYAMNKLREVAARLRKPELVQAFGAWVADWYEFQKAKLRAEAKRASGALADEVRTVYDLEREVAELKHELGAMTADRNNLRGMLPGLDDAHAEAEKLMAEQMAKEKEKRVEHLYQKMTRRFMNQGIARGFSAWLQLWEARTYALARMKVVANRLQKPALSMGFSYWLADYESEKRSEKMAQLVRQQAGLQGAQSALEKELEQVRREYEEKLRAKDDEKELALQRQYIELTGTSEEREAARAEREKEERVELLRRQIMRRMMNQGIASGFAAWYELWSAKTYAMRRLRECGQRLKAPELAWGFKCWLVEWESVKIAEEKLAYAKRLKELRGGQENLVEEVDRLRAQLAELQNEKQQRIALERQIVELTGTTEEQLAMRAEKEKEERIELLRRQVTRRMMNQGIASGWAAWHALWSAKVYSMKRLRECANRLKTPDLEIAFNFWAADCEKARQLKEFEILERASKSVEAQLRHARHEKGQLELMRVAHEDEIRSLRERMRSLLDEVGLQQTGLISAAGLKKENDELKEKQRIAQEAAEAAGLGQDAAEKDAELHRQAQKELLERLLAEQRRGFEQEMEALRKGIDERVGEYSISSDKAKELERTLKDLQETSSRAASKADLQITNLQQECDQLRAEAAAAAHEFARMQAEMRDEHEKTIAELAEAKKKVPKPRPPSPPEKKEKKKGTSPLGNIDLDEGPNAPSISEQLAAALRVNATRVLDLFRDWDVDGDGEVSRKEFHRAMPALGLQVPKQSIDELFSEWDKGGDGTLDFKELKKILSAPTAKKEVKKAANTTLAVAKMARLMTPAPAPPPPP